MTKVELTIKDDSGNNIYKITYIFKDNKVISKYGNLTELNNPKRAIEILNILGNVRDYLEKQINMLGKKLKAIKTNIESEIYS